jgi:hypothetical protein
MPAQGPAALYFITSTTTFGSLQLSKAFRLLFRVNLLEDLTGNVDDLQLRGVASVFFGQRRVYVHRSFEKTDSFQFPRKI